MKKVLFVISFVLIAQLAFAQGFKSGDTYLGGRVALGGVGNASLGFGLNGEYGIGDNLGVGFVGMYSGYSEDVGGVFYSGKWSYTNIYVLGMVTYHYDVFGLKNLDTYGAFNIGYNVASAKWEWVNNPGGFPEPSASVGGFVWGFTFNARYFIMPSLALTASLGYGIGYLHLGVDFKL
ncbi:MAG: hypothetical protein WHV63_09560 [Ignavibacteria bacterium]|jgi:hypothetical protein|nr:hypothetical protein [Ignavibacteria bacterium]